MVTAAAGCHIVAGRDGLAALSEGALGDTQSVRLQRGLSVALARVARLLLVLLVPLVEQVVLLAARLDVLCGQHGLLA